MTESVDMPEGVFGDRPPKAEDLLGQVDLCFVVDTTSSMHSWIDAAKEKMKEVAEEIAGKGELNMRYAIVEFRDHPPEDLTFVTKVHNWSDAKGFQEALEGMYAAGGGDRPEAVFDGLVDAAHLQWRPEADKTVFLIGDSPPHAECPCHATANGIIELFKGYALKLNAFSIAGFVDTGVAFKEMVEPLNGKFSEGAALEAVAFAGAVVSDTSDLVGASRTVAAYHISHVGASLSMASHDLGMTEEALAGTKTYMASRGLDETGKKANGDSDTPVKDTD